MGVLVSVGMIVSGWVSEWGCSIVVVFTQLIFLVFFTSCGPFVKIKSLKCHIMSGIRYGIRNSGS